MTVGEAYTCLYTGALVILAVLIGVMLIRSIRGPGVTDRILSINMIGTMVISCIAVLYAYLGESYLLDVALIYTMISFVTVLVLASVYIPAKPKRKEFAHENDKASGVVSGRPKTKKKERGKRL
jgi:multicomponent Na+:H+ antiporter subunit F